MTTQAAAGPLAPFRVIDLTNELGQLAGRMLGDLGAEVIKVEQPGGDESRFIGPFRGDVVDPEYSLHWWTFNANKLGATLDLTRTAGQELFTKLLDTADFLIETCPPDAAAALGLGVEAVHSSHPGLVHTSITPFGRDGPYANWKATDLVGTAMGGLSSLCGAPGRPPIRPTASQGFTQASAQAVVGTLIAHYQRTKTGRGQHVDQSMQEAVTFTHDNASPTWDIRGINNGRPGNGREIGGYKSGQYVYEAADGYVAALSYGGLFGLTARQTIEWLDHHGMAGDLTSEEWLAKLDATQGILIPPTGEDGDHLNDVLVAFCKQFTRAQLVTEAQQIRNGWGIVHTPRDLLENEHLAAREYWTEIEHEEAHVTYPGPWARLSKTPISIRHRAPRIGEHNFYVYGNLLGFSDDEIMQLSDEGAI